MKRAVILLLLTLTLATIGYAQQIPVVGLACPAAGQTGITAAGIAVTCTQTPGGGTLIWTNIATPGVGAQTNTPNTFTAPQTFAADVAHRGPNLGVDITAPPFNARAVSTSLIPQSTGTITSGLNTLVVASNNPPFQVGDGLAQVGGGATNCGTQPAAPTGFAGLASSMTGTGHAVAGATGSTAYSYVVSALSQGGCYTAASPILTISNGNAALGATNIPITSCVNVAGLVTCTVGSTTGLATGMWVRIGGTTDDTEFGDRHNITVINGTQFTYTSNNSSIYPMISTSATGGTLYFWVENHIALPALPAGTNLYKYAVWRCTGASCALPANAANYSLVYISYPANLGFIDVAYNTWDDYGSISTVTIGQSAPWYLQSTPPATNVNDMLIARITGIAGNAFTLDTAATNTVGATSCNGGPCPVRFDNAPAITAAQVALNTTSSGGGGSLHFPPQLENGSGGVLCYVTSSYFVLNTISRVGGAVCSGETVELSGNRAALNGELEDTIHSAKSSFDNQSLLQWTCAGGNPCIWRKGPPVSNLLITTSGPGENLIFDSSASQTLTEGVHFNVPDGMGISYHAYEATFGSVFKNTGWTSGPSQVIGAVDTPAYINVDSLQTTFDGVNGSLRGLYWECTNNPPNSCEFYITVKMNNEWQGEITPIITVNAVNGGRLGAIKLENLIQDSGAESYFVNASNGGSLLSSVAIDWAIPIGSDPPHTGNAHPIIGGNQMFGGVSLRTTNTNTAGQAGMNHDLIACSGQPASNNVVYSGCILPSLNLATSTYGVNHTLNGSEGIVNASASGITFTLPHALANQRWEINNPTAGAITIAIDSGTLSGNGTTGSISIPSHRGAVASCDGTNCNVLGPI